MRVPVSVLILTVIPPFLVGVSLVVMAACSSGPAPASSPSPMADPVNVAACRVFASPRAVDYLQAMTERVGTGDGAASLTAGTALEEMTGGAGLARGQVKDAMDRAVTAVGIVRDHGGYSTPDDLQAVRLTLAEVRAACRDAGADVDLEV